MVRKFAVWLQLLGFIFGPSAFADIYTWKDDRGVVQFSQFKPRDNRISLKYQPESLQTVATVSVDLHQASKTENKVKKRSAKLRPRKRRKLAMAQCPALKEQLHNMHSRMRSGYDSGQEKKLRSKKRALEREYYLTCIK